jgi:SH3 domain
MAIPEKENLQKVHVCLYDYQGDDTTEVSAQEGDLMMVLNQDESGWWLVYNAAMGTAGNFPCNFTEPANLRKLHDDAPDTGADRDASDQKHASWCKETAQPRHCHCRNSTAKLGDRARCLVDVKGGPVVDKEMPVLTVKKGDIVVIRDLIDGMFLAINENSNQEGLVSPDFIVLLNDVLVKSASKR